MDRNLKSIRKAAGIRQLDLAAALDVSKQTINKWEMGRVPVAHKHWNKLASLLNIDESEIEAVLVQTLLDGCIERGDPRELINAQISRLYGTTLIYDAVLRFEEKTHSKGVGHVDSERDLEILRYERELLERDKRIFELERQVDALKKELERTRRPASLSSVLSEVK